MPSGAPALIRFAQDPEGRKRTDPGLHELLDGLTPLPVQPVL